MMAALLLIVFVGIVIAMTIDTFQKWHNCPFCGTKNEKDSYMSDYDHKGRMYYCNNCGGKY